MSVQVIIHQNDKTGYQFRAQDFDLGRWSLTPDSEALPGGRGASRKIIIENQSYVLRRYLRGGHMAWLVDRYIWSGQALSRPALEHHVVSYAREKKLPVPLVAAYLVEKEGLFYRAAIISRYVANQGTLASYLYKNELPVQHWEELGSLISRFHHNRIFHADLNANNILIGKDMSLHLIDFDKARIISSKGGWMKKNLQRLFRSLEKIEGIRAENNKPFHYSDVNRESLLKGYSAFA